MTPALQGLTQYRQFILYKLVPSRTQGKMDKLPVNPVTLEVSDAHNPAIWKSYDEIRGIKTSLNSDFGIGFVFTNLDPFFFLDIDDCITETGYSDIALWLLQTLQGAAVEVSQSGKGLHIFGTTRPVGHGNKNKEYNIELYTTKRFVALTDIGTSGNVLTDCTQGLATVIQYCFPVQESTITEDWRDQPVPEWNGPLDDEALIAKACASGSGKATFGHGATFNDLWTGNVTVLSQAYPSRNDIDPYDRSSADAALAQHLAFWTGKNHSRIWTLMCKSALLRDKWTWHKTYLQMTISNAVNKQKDVYSSGKQQPPVNIGGSGSEGIMSSGMQLLTPVAQQDHFKGCVYVSDQHSIFVPDGRILKPEQFKVAYGGYTFGLDNLNDKTTRNAWECFTESQAIKFPKVHTQCFRPELTPGQIIEEESRTLVNTYVPIITKRTKGDPTPFYRFMELLITKEDEREIIMNYIAACVQHKGVKFQWCPLIQGAEGNGKTLLGSVVEFAIGHRYSHRPNSADLGGGGFKYNDWIRNKLLIIIEEIYTSDRREITEPLKVFITNSRGEIQAKHGNQYTGDNRANFVLFSNHKDALFVTIDTRRYYICYTAQQSYSDIVRCGMGGEYFPRLYNWLRQEQGYEIVNELLQTFPISASLNPAGALHRAPMSSGTREAIELSVGAVEAEIMEAIDEGRPGFVEPWISSLALAELLTKINKQRQVPSNKRRALLEKLGYVRHPGLENGRVHQDIPYEQGKPRLYIKVGHQDYHATGAAEIRSRYMRSQGMPESIESNVVPIKNSR